MTTIALFQKLSGHPRVTTREVAQLAEISIPTASMALSRLAQEGLVTRVKHGAWLVGSAAKKPAAIVAAAAHPYQAYLSGWSALRHHGRIQQFPEVHFGITLGRPMEFATAGARVRLHRIAPILFTGYEFEAGAEGLVALPEKAIFDVAYLAAMGRSPVTGQLPEVDLRGLRWSLIQEWVRKVASLTQRKAVQANLAALREQHAGVD